jgi:hypothetical protein
MRKIRILLFGIAPLFGFVATASAVRKKSLPVNGLLMSITPDSSVAGPDRAARFIVTFRNLNDREMTVTAGTLSFGCNNGAETSVIDRIKLNLIGSRGKVRRQFSLMGDGPSLACSAVAPYQVEIQPGAAVSFPLDVRKYFDSSNTRQGFAASRFPKGTFSLQAELDATPALTERSSTKVWQGTVTSNLVKVRFGKAFAAAN